MIKREHLKNRVYKEKQCIRFEFYITGEREEQLLSATFTRIIHEFPVSPLLHEEWNLNVTFPRTSSKDTEVINIGYIMPKNGMPLEMVASIGLRYYKEMLQEEVASKSVLDFAIGEVIGGL